MMVNHQLQRFAVKGALAGEPLVDDHAQGVLVRGLAGPSQQLFGGRVGTGPYRSPLRLFGWLSAFAMLAALTADLLILRPTAMYVNQLAMRFRKK